MLDVELVLKKHEPLQTSMLYLYRSGILKNDVREWVDKSARRTGLPLYGGNPESVGTALRGENLFGAGITLIDLGNFEHKGPRQLEAEPLNLVSKTLDDLDPERSSTISQRRSNALAMFFSNLPNARGICVILCPYHPSLAAAMHMLSDKGHGVLIEEADTRKPACVVAIVKYLAATSDLIENPGSFDHKPLTRYLQAYASAHPRAHFPALRSEFDLTVVLYADPITGLVKLPEAELAFEGSNVPFRLITRVRALLRRPMLSEYVSLTKQLSDHVQSDCYLKLVIATTRILHLEAKRDASKANDRQRARILIWAVFLLANVPRCERHDEAADYVMSMFIRRLSASHSGDPLDGQWANIRRAVIGRDKRSVDNSSRFSDQISRDLSSADRCVDELRNVLSQTSDSVAVWVRRLKEACSVPL